MPCFIDRTLTLNPALQAQLQSSRVGAASTTWPLHSDAQAVPRKAMFSNCRATRLARWILLASAFATSVSFAQTKGGTMKVVASGPPGTAVDVIARSLATYLSSSLGVTAVVDNKVGAGGNIAAGSAAMSPPDGMTLLVAANNVATINPFVFSKLKYSFEDDLIPVGHLGGGRRAAEKALSNERNRL